MFKGFSKGSLKAKLIIVLVVGIVMALSISVFAALEKDVIVTVDGNSITIKTTKSTVGEALKDSGIIIGDNDQVLPISSTKVSDGMNVVVNRALNITIKVDGVEIKTTSLPTTSSAILAAAGVTINEKDFVVPNRGTVVKSSGTIVVKRVTEKVVTRNYVVPFKTQKKEDNTLSIGTTKVLTQGVNGSKKEIYKITYSEGKMVGKEMASRTFPSQPVNKVVAVGTKVSSREDTRGRAPSDYKKAMTFRSTAYTHTGNRTATGTKARVGVIAVDPRVIPLGTKVYVEGYGYATAEDTGGAIKGNIIDVFLNSNSECRNWGRRTVTVYIL